MANLEVQFESFAEKARNLRYTPKDEEKLTLYGLYKQANCGNNHTAKPHFLELKNVAKWEAWDKNRGLCKDDAMKKYIAYVKMLALKQD